MSKIIENVPFTRTEPYYESATCRECGCGYAILEEGKHGHNTEENRKYIGEKCSCGEGHYELETGHYVYEDGGYVRIECTCGSELYINNHVSYRECNNCERCYDNQGRELAPRREWDGDEW